MKNLKNLLATRKYFILDLDGTLYLGNKLFSFTKKFLTRLRTTGRMPIFLTNNSSKSAAECFQKLSKMGLQPKRNEIYTSGEAMLDFLRAKKLKQIFLLAPPAVEKEFKQAGFNLLQKNKNIAELKSLRAQTFIPKKQDQKSNLHFERSLPKAVVLAFDTTFNYQKFCQAYDFIMAGVPFYATHPDKLLPLENLGHSGECKLFHPDIGTLISAFETATTKSPTIIGKPYKTIYQQLQKRLKCGKNEMVVFGDRLYTDIKGAHDYDILSVLVLSGEATKSMIKKSKIKPDFVVKDLAQVVPYL